MKQSKPRYQQGSISKVRRAQGFVWKVRFSEYKEGKRWQRTLTFDGSQYRNEKAVRAALELTVAQVNAGTAGEKADAKFSAVTSVYRTKHLPTLQHSTQTLNEYLLTSYIEPKFGSTPIREMSPLVIDEWIQGLKLAATSKASIRSVMSVCYRLAALHQFVPENTNPMSLIRLKGVSKRQKPIQKLTVAGFRELLRALPEPIDTMVLVSGSLGLRVSETVALHWEDIDWKAKTITIQRKFTFGELGDPKSDASRATLPLDDKLIRILKRWQKTTEGSELMFPSSRTGSYRAAGMILQDYIRPTAERLKLGRITWHTLRHACRSWLSAEGVELTVAKDMLRHADISTTANVYGHTLPDAMREAHNKLAAKLHR